MKIKYIFLGLTTAILISGCSQNNDLTDVKNRQDAFENRIIKLEKMQFDQIKNKNEEHEVGNEDVGSTRQLLALKNIINSFTEDLNGLGDNYQVLVRQLEDERKLSDEYNEEIELIKKRLILLELELKNLSSLSRVSQATLKTQFSDKSPDSSEKEERKLFEEINKKFDNKDYEASSSLLKEYKSKYEQGQFIGQILYFSGQIFFANEEYKKAAVEFWEIVKKHTDSLVYNDAKWLLGVSLERSQQIQLAKEIYEQIMGSDSSHRKKALLRHNLLANK